VKNYGNAEASGEDLELPGIDGNRVERCYHVGMAKRTPIFTIYRDKELGALASSARQEIIDVLAQMGDVSVGELAQTLGRPADTLYYHLRLLQNARLVENAGTRMRQGRPEVLYHARNLNIDYEAARQTNDKALIGVASSMLRLGIRDFREAVRNNRVVVDGKQRELWSARKIGRLTKKNLERVNDMIKSLLSAVSPGSPEGQLYGITVLLTPLNRLRRGTAGAKRRKRNSKTRIAGLPS
jgi:DNA-binding transcriptional ArsR family regulator